MISTVALYGCGKFKCNEDGEIYEIGCLYAPPTGSGKDIVVIDREDPELCRWMSYEDGKILDFVCDRVDSE